MSYKTPMCVSQLSLNIGGLTGNGTGHLGLSINHIPDTLHEIIMQNMPVN